MVSQWLYFKLGQRDKPNSDKSQKREEILLAEGGRGAGQSRESRNTSGNTWCLNGALVQLFLLSHSPICPVFSFVWGRARCLKTTSPRLPCQQGPEGNPKAEERKKSYLLPGLRRIKIEEKSQEFADISFNAVVGTEYGLLVAKEWLKNKEE